MSPEIIHGEVKYILMNEMICALLHHYMTNSSGPLFTKPLDVLLPNLRKSRSREIGCGNDNIALKFGRYLGRAAAVVPVICQSDTESSNSNIDASRLLEIFR